MIILDNLFFGPTDAFLEQEDFEDAEDTDLFATQSYAAQQRIETLSEKIRNKSQALKALKLSKKSDDAKVK